MPRRVRRSRLAYESASLQPLQACQPARLLVPPASLQPQAFKPAALRERSMLLLLLLCCSLYEELGGGPEPAQSDRASGAASLATTRAWQVARARERVSDAVVLLLQPTRRP
jgi:hypothetical protein